MHFQIFALFTKIREYIRWRISIQIIVPVICFHRGSISVSLRCRISATCEQKKNKSYVGLIISYVRHNSKSYVGLIISYVGHNKSYVGLTKSYVGDNKRAYSG